MNFTNGNFHDATGRPHGPHRKKLGNKPNFLANNSVSQPPPGNSLSLTEISNLIEATSPAQACRLLISAFGNGSNRPSPIRWFLPALSRTRPSLGDKSPRAGAAALALNLSAFVGSQQSHQRCLRFLLHRQHFSEVGLRRCECGLLGFF